MLIYYYKNSEILIVLHVGGYKNGAFGKRLGRDFSR